MGFAADDQLDKKRIASERVCQQLGEGEKPEKGSSARLPSQERKTIPAETLSESEVWENTDHLVFHRLRLYILLPFFLVL